MSIARLQILAENNQYIKKNMSNIKKYILATTKHNTRHYILVGIFLFLCTSYCTSFTNADVTQTDTKPPSNVPMSCSVINANNKNDVLVRLQDLQSNEKKSFDEAYEIVKTEYHERINEIFNEKMEKLNNNIYQAESQNIKLCSPFKYETDTKSLNVAREMIKNFRKYECALEVYIDKPLYSGNELYINQGSIRLDTIRSTLRQEVRFSYLAIKQTIEMYNELRLWFPIHRDLLCLIEQMKIYRNALRNFIDQIVRMPSKYYNYGSRYQQ